MATTLTAGDQLTETRSTADATILERSTGSPRLKLGVRARQIALITLLVALVVAITTAVNIAHLTGVIVSRTKDQVAQLSSQIDYAVGQELAHNNSINHLDDYTALASEHSNVRGLMESTIVTSRTIAYLYLTNV